MPRKPVFPSYPKKAHKTGQARIRISGRQVYLGVWRSKASYARYEEELSRWRAEQAAAESGVPAPQHAARVRTIADLAAEFVTYAEQHYRKPDGTPRGELANFDLALKPLLEIHRSTLLRDFGPKALRTVQAEMVRRGWRPRVVNRNIVRVRTVFRWAESEELIPEGRYHALRTVRGLPTGNIDLPPVPEADLAATLPELRRVVRAAVDVQLLTGGRPAEILGLRPGDFARSGRVEIAPGHFLDVGGVWLADLAEHKLAHLGHRRFLLFGPKAQAILAPFLLRPADACLFSPMEAAVDGLRDKGRSVRFRRCRQPGSRYRIDSYGHAIRAACVRAGVTPWTPYRLRHNSATRLCSEFGPEIARIILGHRTLDVTRVYILDNLQKAVEVMRKIG